MLTNISPSEANNLLVLQAPELGSALVSGELRWAKK